MAVAVKGGEDTVGEAAFVWSWVFEVWKGGLVAVGFKFAGLEERSFVRWGLRRVVG
jgi:hypothetical protein